ncbi:YnfA family protein [Cupriavidus sp. H18C1]|uniref:YnfA family protein n=1 Tax=Cupriavidus sp. H18C1 TaxID=3241601 RepID=UPI003BB8D0E7
MRSTATLPASIVTFLAYTALFVLTALAEIVGCYLPYLVLKQEKTPLLLIPAALALAAFAWLLTLHPTAAGRTYAAYGGVYIAVALLWLRIVDGLPLTRWDVLGAAVALAGMAIIVLQPTTGAGTG